MDSHHGTTEQGNRHPAHSPRPVLGGIVPRESLDGSDTWMRLRGIRKHTLAPSQHPTCDPRIDNAEAKQLRDCAQSGRTATPRWTQPTLAESDR
eukprot:953041-Amphidinium_carterae.1